MKLVDFINWFADSSRRDLTYNAMSLSLDGTLYDYFGGVEDLNNHRTAFVGDAEQRIREDYLRILRYFRFKGRQPKVTWDDATMAAIAKTAEGLTRISGERIWAEMSKILAGNHVVEILQEMQQTKVLQFCGFVPMNNMSKVQALKDKGVNDPRIILAALVETPAALFKIQQRWKWDNVSHKLMYFIIDHRSMKLDFKTLVQMLVIDGADRSHLEAICIYRGMGNLAQAIKDWQIPKFPLSGDDLMKAGMKPGKELGDMIKTLKLIWLESDFTMTTEQLIRQALKTKLS